MNFTFLSPRNPHYILVVVIEPTSHADVFRLLFLLPEESYFSYLNRNEVPANMGRVIALLRSGRNQNQHVMVGGGGTIPSSQCGRKMREYIEMAPGIARFFVCINLCFRSGIRE